MMLTVTECRTLVGGDGWYLTRSWRLMGVLVYRHTTFHERDYRC